MDEAADVLEMWAVKYEALFFTGLYFKGFKSLEANSHFLNKCLNLATLFRIMDFAVHGRAHPRG